MTTTSSLSALVRTSALRGEQKELYGGNYIAELEAHPQHLQAAVVEVLNQVKGGRRSEEDKS